MVEYLFYISLSSFIYRIVRLATEVFLWLARTQETFCNPIRGPLGSRLLQEDSRLKRNEVISHNYKRYLWAPFLNLGGNGVEGADWECYLPLKGTKAALSLLQAYTPLNSPYHYFRSLQLFFFIFFCNFLHIVMWHTVGLCLFIFHKNCQTFIRLLIFFIFRLWSPPFGGINEFFPFLKAFFPFLSFFFLPLTHCTFSLLFL